ncbi:MAG: hydroxymethylglutaryl-CoA lyase [Bacteriovorax sp.]|nr:hydroxymethylglutaryl-CoA lyase [Bacteriovorax sp.]
MLSNSFLNLPKKVRIVEVGPRDGLQNEKSIVSLENKLKFIKLLNLSGLHEIEATSFVRAQKIPQMSDGGELFNLLKKDSDLLTTRLISLVPNLIGMEAALNAGVRDIAVFTSTSNSFNKKNINASIDESMLRIKELMALANANKISTRGYISTVFGCPYEGKTSLDQLKKIADQLLELGVYEISLGDTIGIANPKQVAEVIEFLSKDFKLDFLSMHFHDTRGLAVANVLTSFEMGITSFDSSAGGLGGCPYALGASGNVATEDLYYLFDSLGIETGIDIEKLSAASSFILKVLNREGQSKFLKAYLSSKSSPS